MNILRHFILSITLLSVSACNALTPKPGNDLYVLKSEPITASATSMPLSAKVGLPQTSAGLNTARIAITDSPNHITYYTGVSWAEPLPQLTQSFLVDALQQAHLFTSVSSDREAITADMLILTDLNDFSFYERESTVHLRAVFKLADANSRKVLLTMPIEKTATPAANKMDAIAAAFNSALQQATADWIARLQQWQGVKKN